MSSKSSSSRVVVSRQLFEDINKVLFIDSNILNFSTFYPGKLLGSTLTVGNLTTCEQIVELSVDA